MNETESLSLRDSLNTIFRRSYIIKLVLVLLPVSTLVACFLVTPSFQTAAKVLVTAKNEGSGLLLTSPQAGPATHVSLNVEELDLNSEMEILLSVDLWVRAMKKLGADFFGPPQSGGPLKVLKGALSDLVDTLGLETPVMANKPSMADDHLTELAKTLAESTKVVPAPKSKVLEIRFRWNDPVKAQKILSTLLDCYIPYHLEMYTPLGAQDFFSEEVKQYRQHLAQVEAKAVDFRKQWQISFPEKQKEALIAQIAAIRDSLTDINSNIIQYRNMLESVKRGVIPTGQLAMAGKTSNENTVINVLSTQLLRARQTKLEAREHFTAQSRDYAAADELVKGLLAELRQTLESELTNLESKQDSLNRSMEIKAKELVTLEEKSQEGARLDLESAVAKEKYLQYVGKAEEARLGKTMQGKHLGNVRVVSSPFLPSSPVFPKTGLFVLGSIILALPLGLGIILVANFLDHTFDTPAEVESYMRDKHGLKVLASFRQVPSSRSRG